MWWSDKRIRTGAAMAIKFVDIEPEDGKPKKAEAPPAKPLAVSAPAHDTPEALSNLPHAKPVPKKRGRK